MTSPNRHENAGKVTSPPVSGAPELFGRQFMLFAVLSVFGVVLGAWYMLYLVQRVFFGPLREGEHHSHDDPPVRDLSLREFFALAPLVVFMVWIGLVPQFFLERMSPTLSHMTGVATQAFDRTYHLQPAVARPAVSSRGEWTRVD